MIKLLDNYRDNILVKYDVKIEDIEGNIGSLWKLYKPNKLFKIIEKQKNEKIKKDLKNKINQINKNINIWKKKSINPKNLFNEMTDDKKNKLYSKFDENGKPIEDINGKQLSKKAAKKIDKVMFMLVFINLYDMLYTMCFINKYLLYCI